MTRTWKMFGLQTVLAAALTASPAVAVDGPPVKDSPLKKLTQRVEDLETAMGAVQRAVDMAQKTAERAEAHNLKTDRAIKEMRAQLNRIEAALKALTKPQEKLSAYPPEALDDLSRRLDRIEKALSPSVRISRAPPAEVGRIILTNQYAETITFIINKSAYPVRPGQTAVLDGQPAGPFTYEILSPTWGERGKATTTLAAGREVRLTVD